MKTSFPTDTGYSGMYLQGYRRHLVNSSAQLMGTVVVKRNYQLDSGTLTPIDDPDGIRVTDLQRNVTYDGEDIAISDYEPDIAIYKPLADLVIHSGYSAGHQYQLNVRPNSGATQVWFRRTISSPPPLAIDADAQEYVFGWQPRFEGIRFTQGNIPQAFPNPAPDVPDMSGFNNLFFNSYRREFARPGFPLNQFNRGDTVSMTRTVLGETNSDSVFEFVLGQESIHANLYLYTGQGPDTEPYWCVQRPIDFRLDTLVVTPSENNVYALWRGGWDFNQYPASRYRQLEVIAQGVSHG